MRQSSANFVLKAATWPARSTTRMPSAVDSSVALRRESVLSDDASRWAKGNITAHDSCKTEAAARWSVPRAREEPRDGAVVHQRQPRPVFGVLWRCARRCDFTCARKVIELSMGSAWDEGD